MTAERAARMGRYGTKSGALAAIAKLKKPERYKAVHVIAHDDEMYPWCLLARRPSEKLPSPERELLGSDA